jgi:hypothetical protein
MIATLHAVFVCPRPDARLCGLIEVSMPAYSTSPEAHAALSYLEAVRHLHKEL